MSFYKRISGMPIERKDRSFDIIFDQVSLDHVPAEYILEIIIDLVDGKQLTMTKEDLARIEKSGQDVVNHIMQDDIKDIQVKIDFERVKSDVLNGVGGFLGKYFK
jgi:hypothetical protein